MSGIDLTRLKKAMKALEDPDAPDRARPNAFTVSDHHGYFVLYHGDELVAKIKPEHAPQIVEELQVALAKRRGKMAGGNDV